MHKANEKNIQERSRAIAKAIPRQMPFEASDFGFKIIQTLLLLMIVFIVSA